MQLNAFFHNDLLYNNESVSQGTGALTFFTRRLFAALFCLTAVFAPVWASAATSPGNMTSAWGQVFSDPNGVQMGGIDTDASGYCYLFYVTGGGATTTTAHLAKIGPANTTAFVQDIPFPSGDLSVDGAYVAPKVDGVQYVYGVAADSTGKVQVWAYTSAGNFVNSFTINNAPQETVVGAAPLSNGHLTVATAAQGPGGARLELYDLDASAGTSTSAFCTDIFPIDGAFDPGTNSWFVTGADPNDPNAVNAVWGSYSLTDGSRNFGAVLTGSFDPSTGNADYREAIISLLPGNNFALMSNDRMYDASSGLTNSSYRLTLASRANGTAAWSFPASGTFASAILTQVVQYDATSPLYVVGTADNGTAGFPSTIFEKFEPNGTLDFARGQQPVGTLFAASDGFWDDFDWSTTTSHYLEHYNSATDKFDWGKQYGNATFTFCECRDVSQWKNSVQNSLYFVSRATGGTGQIAILERFVTGPALYSITVPPGFTAGNQFTVTINLNQKVPVGKALNVTLYSSSPNVTMPNGTRSQNFTIPAGSQSFPVQVNTASTGSGYSVTFTAIQNGVLRYGTAKGS